MKLENNKVLFLFTNSYPYGNFEQNLNIESKFLSKYFEKVYVFSVEQGGAPRKMPDNFIAIDIGKEANYKKAAFFTHIFLFSGIFLTEAIKTPFQGQGYLKHTRGYLRKLYNAYSISVALQELMRKEKLEQKEIHFYSYWFYHWTLVFAFFKKTSGKKINSVSRAHMADLYQFPYEFSLNPFHYFKIKQIDKLFATSSHGGNYLKKNFPDFKNKISVSRSGIAAEGLNPFSSNDEFVIVTCSTAQRRKRIYMMPEILKLLQFNVRWVHFGEGVELIEIAKETDKLPKNVTVEFRGFVENDRLFQFYLNSPVNVFLNLSTAEGLPFSIIEAIAFGIPVIATDVFGSSEVCTHESGMLLPKELDAVLVAGIISKFRNSEMNTISFRKSVKEFWDREYNSEKNYPDFIRRAFSNIM
ncbi:glycosyltransferase [soil metagenome]